MSAKQLTRVAMLLGMGLGLHLVENAVALPVLLPGAKLGLANVATLLVLAEFGAPAAALFGPLRHILGSALTGTLFLPTFWLGFGGSVVGALVLWRLCRSSRLHTAGVLSGAAFQIGQSGALVVLAASAGAWSYLPPLLALGVGAGWLTGLLARWLVSRLGYLGQQDKDTPWLLGMGLLLVAVAASVLVAVAGPGRQGNTAVVLVAGEERMALPLSRDGQYELELPDGHMTLQVSGGAIRVAFSDCDDQVCVRTGWITTRGVPIVCVPYRVTIEVRGGEDRLDGVVQ